jgi:hypothetical protein
MPSGGTEDNRAITGAISAQITDSMNIPKLSTDIGGAQSNENESDSATFHGCCSLR